MYVGLAQGALGPFAGPLGLPHEQIRRAQMDHELPQIGIVGAEPHGCLDRRDAVFRAPRGGVGHAEREVGPGVARVEFDRPRQFRNRQPVLAPDRRDAAQRIAGTGVLPVELDRLAGQREARLPLRPGPLGKTADDPKEAALRGGGVGRHQSGIGLDRAVEQMRGFGQVRLAPAVQMRHAPLIDVPGIQALGPLRLRALPLRVAQRRLGRSRFR